MTLFGVFSKFDIQLSFLTIYKYEKLVYFKKIKLLTHFQLSL